jgi:hypothetical protein
VSARALVDALTAVAPRFARRDRDEKRRLLEELGTCAISDAPALLSLHEALCFLQAYPDDRAVLDAVDRGLAAFSARVKRLPPPVKRRLHDSGIVGTTLDYPFGLPMARWLSDRFPGDAEIRWAALADNEPLQETLPLLVERVEDDAVSDEGGLGARRWLRVAKGGRSVTDLRVLVELFDRARLSEEARDSLFESLALSIGWRLAVRAASRTGARLPSARPFFHGGSRGGALLRPDQREFARHVKRPLPSLARAPRALGHTLIETARVAMATRSRELFAFSYANVDDILVADPGRGLRVALIGILPRFRLPLHGYYAYLALKNGVPVGYGGGWQLFGALEVGVNIFESFRRGESAFIVSQVLRAYHQAFGMRVVVVDPYQIGHDNQEALESGAFYFYRHLGFRPRDPAVRRLADAEQDKIDRDVSYRTPLAVLAQLARSEVYLPLSGREPETARRLTASALAALVTGHIARRFEGDRRAAAREAIARVQRALGVRIRGDWPADERRAFEDLAPVATLIPDLERWPAADQRRLVDVMRAKGGPSESRYVRLLDGHARLRKSLEALLPAGNEP